MIGPYRFGDARFGHLVSHVCAAERRSTRESNHDASGLIGRGSNVSLGSDRGAHDDESVAVSRRRRTLRVQRGWRHRATEGRRVRSARPTPRPASRETSSESRPSAGDGARTSSSRRATSMSSATSSACRRRDRYSVVQQIGRAHDIARRRADRRVARLADRPGGGRRSSAACSWSRFRSSATARTGQLELRGAPRDARVLVRTGAGSGLTSVCCLTRLDQSGRCRALSRGRSRGRRLPLLKTPKTIVRYWALTTAWSRRARSSTLRDPHRVEPARPSVGAKRSRPTAPRPLHDHCNSEVVDSSSSFLASIDVDARS